MHFKKIIIVMLIVLTAIFMFADETNDGKSISNASGDSKKFDPDAKRREIDYFMKFRGSLSFVFTYYIPFHDGINPGDHVARVDANPLDLTEKGDPDMDYRTGGPGRILNYTGNELKLYFKYDFIAPFFAGDHWLIADNNIKFSVMGEISPVSLNGGMEVTLTPVPFTYFSAGFLIGPAWDLLGIKGLGYNGPQGPQTYPVAGPHMQLWFSVALQVDLAYLFPKEYQRWTHIVMYTIPKIKYMALLNIDDQLPYVYEADRGENLNGWRYMQESFIGYQIDFREDDIGDSRTFLRPNHTRVRLTAGMYANIEKLDITNYSKSPMASKGGWGSDFVTVEFGPTARLELPYNFWLIIFATFINDRAYTDETVGNAFYQERDYEDWYVHFRRIGFFFGWNF